MLPQTYPGIPVFNPFLPRLPPRFPSGIIGTEICSVWNADNLLYCILFSHYLIDNYWGQQHYWIYSTTASCGCGLKWFMFESALYIMHQRYLLFIFYSGGPHDVFPDFINMQPQDGRRIPQGVPTDTHSAFRRRTGGTAISRSFPHWNKLYTLYTVYFCMLVCSSTAKSNGFTFVDLSDVVQC